MERAVYQGECPCRYTYKDSVYLAMMTNILNELYEMWPTFPGVDAENSFDWVGGGNNMWPKVNGDLNGGGGVVI